MGEWPQKKLGDIILDIKDGGTPSRATPQYFGGDVYWCVVKDIKPRIFDTAEKLTALGLKNCSAKVWPVDSVIISLGATVGQIGIAKVPTATKQGLSGIIVDPQQITPEFLAYALHAQKEYIQSLATGTTIKEVRPTKLKEMVSMPVPPLGEQRRLVTILDEAFAAIAAAAANAEKNLSNAYKLFDSVLARSIDTNRLGWTTCTIADLVEKGIIFTPLDGNHGEIHPKKSDFVEAGVPFIMASDLGEGSVNLRECNFISGKTAKGLRKGFAKNHDVLLSHKGTIGRVAILNTDLDFVVLTPQVTYYRVKDSAALSNRYMRWFFESRTFRDEMGHIAGAGSTRAYIGITRQLDLHFSYPSLSEQIRIATIADNLMNTVGMLRKTYLKKIASLDELRRSLLKRAFEGKLDLPSISVLESAAE
jgi:type I restriction enzyme S subunit